ncbi:hypothetical protein F5882DRAFT_93620 [Hyaloscypha sp. PMI_1271]|nr:hypothetical protein F5882DRAFT_93620 [Hyaloscypha sp. PMI_1271]
MTRSPLLHQTPTPLTPLTSHLPPPTNAHPVLAIHVPCPSTISVLSCPDLLVLVLQLVLVLETGNSIVLPSRAPVFHPPSPVRSPSAVSSLSHISHLASAFSSHEIKPRLSAARLFFSLLSPLSLALLHRAFTSLQLHLHLPQTRSPILHSHALQPTHRFPFGRETRRLRLAVGVCDCPVRQARFGKPRLGLILHSPSSSTSDKIWGEVSRESAGSPVSGALVRCGIVCRTDTAGARTTS